MPSAAIALTDGRTISRSIRSSSAGVTTSAGEYVPIPPVFGPVSPPDALVILRRRQNHVVAPRHHHENRGLFAEETVLDQDLSPARAKLPALEHLAHRRFGFGERLRDDHAFARGQAVGFDHDRDRARAKIRERRRDLAEERRRRRRNSVFQEDLLRENLRRFESGAVGFRAVGGNSGCDQLVDESERQRHFGTDDDELDLLALSERDQSGDVIRGDVEARDVFRDAGIARRADDARLAGDAAARGRARVRARRSRRPERSEEVRFGHRAKNSDHGNVARLGFTAIDPTTQSRIESERG